MSKPTLRTIRFWVLYDPLSGVVMQTEKYKYQLPAPSKGSCSRGAVIVEMKGFYVPTPPNQE